MDHGCPGELTLDFFDVKPATDRNINFFNLTWRPGVIHTRLNPSKGSEYMVKRNTILVLILLTFTFLPFAFAGDAEHVEETPVNELDIRIKADPCFGTAPMTVSFDATDFLYHYGENLAFSWDFSDGRGDSGVSVSHTFEAAGTYVVAVKVETPFGFKNAWAVVIATPE